MNERTDGGNEGGNGGVDEVNRIYEKVRAADQEAGLAPGLVYGEALATEEESLWRRIFTKRFIISMTIIWQYFGLVVALLYTGTAAENAEMLVVYSAGVAYILNYYMKSDVERHAA